MSLERCLHRGLQMTAKPENSVSVTQHAKCCIATAESFVSLIGAIQTGELPVWVPSGCNQALGKWRLSKGDLAKWRPDAETTGGARLSVGDAAAQLGVKQEVAYALVRAGLLPVTTESVGRHAAQWVDVQALSGFQKQYILGTELAAFARTSPKRMAQRLKACGIQPVAGPGSARVACRQYVWQRTSSVLSAAVGETPDR